jgi:cob(I)alamin adenosyltransferase
LAEKEIVLDEVLIYINRLSDLLFTFARAINYREKQKETIWSVKP